MATDRKGSGQYLNEIIEGRRPRLSALEHDPQVKAVVSKLVEGIGHRKIDGKGNRLVDEPSQALMEKISSITATNVSDAESTYQLLPETTLAEQILVSSILSPNDMINVELNYAVEGKELDGEFNNKLIAIIEDYFENHYKIKKILPTMLSEVLFTHGSYPMAILPESSIDDAINSYTRVSQESVSGVIKNGKVVNIGILGDNKKATRDLFSVSFESIKETIPLDTTESKVGGDDHLFVTDNCEFLKFPMLHDKITQDRLNDIYTVRKMGLEAFRDEKSPKAELSDAQLENSLYKKRYYKHIPIIPMRPLDQLDKETVGHPLVMVLPPESVIPIHVPANPDEHIGYFMLCDETGNPVTKAMNSDYYADLASNLHQNKEMVSQMLAMTRRATFGSGQDTEKIEVEEIVKNYSEMVEADLITRLKNGIYGENVKIAKPDQVYRIMLARTLAKMQTRMVFIPASMMTYVAFDYNQYGVGKSLLENTKIIGAIRAMLLFANTMGAIKNSTSHVNLNIELDPDDPDPGHTVEMLVHEYVRTRQRSYPIGASNPLDIIDYLQGAGVDVTVSGNPAYPETKMKTEDYNSSKVAIDNDLDESLKKRHIQAFGLNPETVDLSMNVEFATSIVNSNIQLTKRVMIYQDQVHYFLNDFVSKYTLSSSHLMGQLREVVVAGVNQLPEKLRSVNVDKIIIAFLERLRITLPSPNTVKLENQLAAYTKYVEALEEVMKAYVDSEYLDSNILGDLADSVDAAIAALKAFYKRKWLRDNNVMPELESLIMNLDPDKEHFDLLEAHEKHVSAISESLMAFMQKSIKRVKDANKDLEEMGADLEETQTSDNEEETDTAEDTSAEDDTSLDTDFDAEPPVEEEPAADETVDEEADKPAEDTEEKPAE